MPEPRFDVVIVAYGSADSIERCVRGAAAVPGAGKVVVVDHGSDGSGALAEAIGATVIVDSSNPGFGAGQNRGVAATGSDYVLLLNPDAVPIPAGVERGVELLDDHLDVAMVQGVVVNDATGTPERSQGRALGPVHLWGRALGLKRLLRWRVVRSLGRRLPGLADHVERAPDEPVDVESLAATAPLVRRTAFDAVGGFDESWFLYGEDLDLCARLRRSGQRLVALPEVWATHAGGGSSSRWWDREIVWWEGTMQYAARWWRAPAFAVGLGAATLRAALLTIVRPSQMRQPWTRLVGAPLRARRHRGRP